MSFASSAWLYALPGVVLVGWILLRPRRRASAPDLAHVPVHFVGPAWLAGRPPWLLRGRGVLLLTGAALVVVALARPQWGEIEETRFDQAREVLVALDLSRSMLVPDVPPDRLTRAKLLVEGLLSELRGERVGLVVFAGSAFLQSPLSADYEVMRDLLRSLDPDFLPQGGTDLEAMLQVSLEGFGQARGADRFLIVLSDGEAHDTGWRARLKDVEAAGVTILCLGIGTRDGGLVPDGSGGFVKDARGAAVLSRLEPAALEALADESGGRYVEATRWVDLAQLMAMTVGRGRAGEFVETRHVTRPERFQLFLAPGLLLLLASFVFELPAPTGRRRVVEQTPVEASSSWRAAARSASAGSALVLALCLGLPAPGRSAEQGAPAEAADLLNLVQRLSDAPDLGAEDYAALAEETIRFAETGATDDRELLDGTIGDALTAVNVGDALDSKAADWASLRRRLEALRPPPEQRQPSDEPSQQDESQPQDGSQSGEPKGSDSNGASGQGEPNVDSGESQSGPSAQGSDQAESPSESSSESKAAPDAESGSASEDQASSSEQSPGADGSEDGMKPGTDDQEKRQVGELDLDAAREEAGEPGALPAPEPAPPAPEQRQVGGGHSTDALVEERPDLAPILGAMQQVAEEDAPGLIHLRMQQAEGTAPDREKGPQW